MATGGDDPFTEFLGELADGQPRRLARSQGWDDFIERLSRLIVDLPVRRRQALVMLLFVLTEDLVSPDEVQTWIADHDVQSEDGLEAMISWLRQFRPR